MKKCINIVKFHVYFFLAKINAIFENKYDADFVLCNTNKKKLFKIFIKSKGTMIPKRIEKETTFFMYKKVKEIILALNPDLSGETTMMFLAKKIKSISPDIKISRLARGLPMGSDLQYADEITLGSSIKNRH